MFAGDFVRTPICYYNWCPVVYILVHYDDVTVSLMASHITSLTIVYSTVYSGADQRKHQSSASLAFVWGIHRGSVNSPHKWPVTRKMFPSDDVIMASQNTKWMNLKLLNKQDSVPWLVTYSYKDQGTINSQLIPVFFIFRVMAGQVRSTWRPAHVICLEKWHLTHVFWNSFSKSYGGLHIWFVFPVFAPPIHWGKLTWRTHLFCSPQETSQPHPPHGIEEEDSWAL